MRTVYIKSKTERYIFKRVIDQYQAEHRIAKPDKIVNYRHVVIQDSLYLAGKKAQLSDQIIMEIVNIFACCYNNLLDESPKDIHIWNKVSKEDYIINLVLDVRLSL